MKYAHLSDETTNSAISDCFEFRTNTERLVENFTSTQWPDVAHRLLRCQPRCCSIDSPTVYPPIGYLDALLIL